MTSLAILVLENVRSRPFILSPGVMRSLFKPIPVVVPAYKSESLMCSYLLYHEPTYWSTTLRTLVVSNIATKLFVLFANHTYLNKTPLNQYNVKSDASSSNAHIIIAAASLMRYRWCHGVILVSKPTRSTPYRTAAVRERPSAPPPRQTPPSSTIASESSTNT